MIVFLEPNLHCKTTAQQRTDLHGALKSCAALAGLAGEVVAVWPDEFSRTRFLAPAHQYPFFQIVSYDQLYAQVNGTLAC